MNEYIKASSGNGVCLKFSSEENGEMLVVWTFDKERSGDVWQTGLGIDGMLVVSTNYFSGLQVVLFFDKLLPWFTENRPFICS